MKNTSEPASRGLGFLDHELRMGALEDESLNPLHAA